jgi:methylthioribose-1-phosphate isomerase
MALNLPVAVAWSPDGRAVRLLDQTLLPSAETYLLLDSVPAMVEAIQALRVRGAPAIGVAAAMALALEAARLAKEPGDVFLQAFGQASDALRLARPTAVNLGWAVSRLQDLVRSLHGAEAGEIACKVYGAATAILDEDRAMCRRMAEHGYRLLPDHGPVRVLTVCNAGALATSGMGTALAPVYHAAANGRDVHVFACETRPLLQGSRITAWELARSGVPCTVAIDSAAPLLLRDGAVDVVLVGADRIAANGDVANKVGTYSLAVHAAQAGIPFYVVAPTSTLDVHTPDGAGIPIEFRNADEVRCGFGTLTAPPAAPVYAPAFDVTPAELITAIITDRGVLRAPFGRAVEEHANVRATTEVT